MTTKLTSREFNHDTARAKRAADVGPVNITDRGRPSHVLINFEDYVKLAAQHPSIAELLSRPPGIEDIEFVIPTPGDVAQPALFD